MSGEVEDPIGLHGSHHPLDTRLIAKVDAVNRHLVDDFGDAPGIVGGPKDEVNVMSIHEEAARKDCSDEPAGACEQGSPAQSVC
jgi:hypothetical protein